MKSQLQVWLVVLALGIVGLSDTVKAFQADANQTLISLFNDDWQARIERDPMLATEMGVKGKDHLLQDVSPEAYARWEKKTQAFLARLSSIPFKDLTEENRLNYQIFQAQLERRVSQIKFKQYQIPFYSDSGFHTRMMRLNTELSFKTIEDYENYLRRLAQIPKYFAQHTTNMRAGLNRGFSMPRAIMSGFDDVIKKAYEQPLKESSLWLPFAAFPQSIAEKDRSRLLEQAGQVLRSEVLPAFEKLYHFFAEEYIPHSKESLGASEFPDGKAFYQAQIAHYTTLDLTADEIHDIGLDEVKRIRAEMAQVIKDSGFKGDFKDFLNFLRESPQFYAKSADDLLKEASYIAKKMDGQLPKLFDYLPRQPYTVEPVPDAIAPKYTTGRYLSAPLDSERPGTYWVNTYALDKRPLYVLEALTLHEAVPGHHLQISLNKELAGLPNFRQHSYISAFGEGWGLYSEKLGLEVGFYQDPYSNFGRLTYEMWRAARLVIDTGLHAKGWTREQAIQLLEENSALSTHNIRTEVDRYISWPGQALAYKLGELKIWELRRKAENALKDKFDLRQFHRRILSNGSIPLDRLEDQIDAFILEQCSDC